MINFKSIFFLPPLHSIVFCYLLGIYLHYKDLFFLPFTIIVLLAVFSVHLLVTINKNIFKALRLSTSIIFVWYGAYSYQRTINHHNQFHHSLAKKSYTVLARVSDIQKNNNARFPHAIYLTDCIVYETQTALHPVKDHCCFIMYMHDHDLVPADIIALHNVSFKKSSKTEFNYYLARQGVSSTIFLNNNHAYTKIYHPTWSLYRWIYEKKMNLYHTFRSKMSPKTQTFFSSLFMGIKENSWFQKKIKNHFNYWGISHYLARSGLHLLVFVMLWNYIFRFFPFYFFIKQIILSFFIMVYCLLSWSSISFVRALLMYIFYTIYSLCDQQASPLHIFLLVTFLILLINPLHLIFLDFQLSFGLTFALLSFARIYRSK